MKSSWIGIGFSHHRVPSLSKTATRSSTGTPCSPHARLTNVMIACLVGPSRQVDSGSLAMVHPPLSTRHRRDISPGEASAARRHHVIPQNGREAPERTANYLI